MNEYPMLNLESKSRT